MVEIEVLLTRWMRVGGVVVAELLIRVLIIYCPVRTKSQVEAELMEHVGC